MKSIGCLTMEKAESGNKTLEKVGKGKGNREDCPAGRRRAATQHKH